MARKHVAKHLKKLDSHHKKFRKQIYKHLKKLARHKGCYVDGPVKRRKTGGAIRSRVPSQKAITDNDQSFKLPPMTKAKSRKDKGASGLVLASGSGFTVGGSGWSRGRKRKKKKRKLPAWVKKPVPGGKKYPKVPRGFSKEASGLWDSIKSGASAIGSAFGKHADTIKKIGSAMGKTALDLGTQYISGKIQQGQAMAQQKIEQAQAMAQQYANQAQNQVQGYVQQGQQYGQQMYNQGQQYAQGMYQQGMQQGQQYVDQGGRMVRQGMQGAKQAIYDEFGNIMGYR